VQIHPAWPESVMFTLWRLMYLKQRCLALQLITPENNEAEKERQPPLEFLATATVCKVLNYLV
jgi:hypothetical protein